MRQLLQGGSGSSGAARIKDFFKGTWIFFVAIGVILVCTAALSQGIGAAKHVEQDDVTREATNYEDKMPPMTEDRAAESEDQNIQETYSANAIIPQYTLRSTEKNAKADETKYAELLDEAVWSVQEFFGVHMEDAVIDAEIYEYSLESTGQGEEWDTTYSWQVGHGISGYMPGDTYCNITMYTKDGSMMFQVLGNISRGNLERMELTEGDFVEQVKLPVPAETDTQEGELDSSEEVVVTEKIETAYATDQEVQVGRKQAVLETNELLQNYFWEHGTVTSASQNIYVMETPEEGIVLEQTVTFDEEVMPWHFAYRIYPGEDPRLFLISYLENYYACTEVDEG